MSFLLKSPVTWSPNRRDDVAKGLSKTVPPPPAAVATSPSSPARTKMGVSKNMGTPKWMICNGKPLLKWMIWGYHDFWKHPNQLSSPTTDTIFLWKNHGKSSLHRKEKNDKNTPREKNCNCPLHRGMWKTILGGFLPGKIVIVHGDMLVYQKVRPTKYALNSQQKKSRKKNSTNRACINLDLCTGIFTCANFGRFTCFCQWLHWQSSYFDWPRICCHNSFT